MGIEICIKKQLGDYCLNVEFDSNSGRLAMLGASGSGKSLTLQCIAGIINPDSGRIVINGKILFDSQAKINISPRERKVGYLFQNYALFPTMTVTQNIGVGVKDKKDASVKVKDLIKKYNLEGLENLYPRQLSGGQQQRVALARMMASEPEIILLDEPFSALDHHLREQMRREVHSYLKDYKGIVILVSHDRDEVYQLSQEMVVIHEGKSVAWGKTTELFARTENFYVARLTGCKNIGMISAEKEGCYIKEWDLNFPILQKTQCFTHVGIRAHHIRVKKPEKEPYFELPVSELTVEEGLWECTISFKTSPSATENLLWKVSKTQWENLKFKELRILYLLEKDLLLLRY